MPRFPDSLNLATLIRVLQKILIRLIDYDEYSICLRRRIVKYQDNWKLRKPENV